MDKLMRDNADLERRLDKDGKEFLEFIFQLEREVEDLKKRNQELEARGPVGDAAGGSEEPSREVQDVMEQLEAFEKEKEEEMQQVRDESAQLQQRLLKQVQTSEGHRLRADELERERDTLLAIMSEEGQELRARLEKALQDKEALSLDLGRAQAMADHAAEAAQAAASSPVGQANGELELASQLRAVTADFQAAKDELSNKEAQLVLQRGQLEGAERKLRLAEYENTMLKSELEALRSQVAGAAAAGAAAGTAPRPGGLIINR